MTASFPFLLIRPCIPERHGPADVILQVLELNVGENPLPGLILLGRNRYEIEPEIEIHYPNPAFFAAQNCEKRNGRIACK